MIPSISCTSCGSLFTLCEAEIKAYKRFDIPAPSTCSECRHKRHLIFRNERKLFNNVSCISGKSIISTYPKSSPFKIIDQDEWWNDSFDTTTYGRDFDFNKHFFEQFKVLQRDVPRWARMFVNCENSDYTNNSVGLKNCYLTFSSYNSEHLYYCMRVMSSHHCVDCLNVRNSEFCSECVECKNGYNLHFSQMCEACSESFYLYDCKNCHHCLMSAQLRNKSYIILNKQYTKGDYEKSKEFFLEKLGRDQERFTQPFNALKQSIFYKNLRLLNTENSTGDFINDSKNVTNGFYVTECEDCTNVYDCHKDKDCCDNMANEKSELALECDTAYELYNAKFCSYTVTARDVAYLDQCIQVKNCFGSVGLRQKQYVILNKQYSKEDYEKLLPKIIDHMRKTGEYGKPFPSTLSSYPYNVSVAQLDHPLTKEAALKQGYMWHDEEEIIGKNFKIIPQELEFYKKFKLPIPQISPDERYAKRSALQPPKRLVDAQCTLCHSPIKTVYPSASGIKIVCEKCYLKKVY